MAEIHRLHPKRRRWWEQWPITLVLAGVVVSLVVVSLDRFRLGSLMLPSHRAGMLAVRSTTVDLVVLGVLAAALAVLALWVPPPT